MNPYEQKQEHRRMRLLTASENAQTESGRRFDTAHNLVEGIPFGQPILVGHHSEKRHRRTLERHDANMRKGFEAQDRARALRGKAASVGTAGISSDDPEAMPKIQERIAELEAKQDQMRAINAAIRKGNDQALRDLGLSDGAIARLKEPDFCGRIGYPAYALQNNSGNIRRLKERVTSMVRVQDDATTEIDAGYGVTIVDNVEENRVQVLFPGKPGEDQRAKLKQWGFRWSPLNKAWQRHRSPRGRVLCKVGPRNRGTAAVGQQQGA